MESILQKSSQDQVTKANGASYG